MKERLILIAVIIALIAAVKFYMPETAESLKNEMQSVFDPEDVVSAMGQRLSENSLVEAFSMFDGGKSEY